ncbi:phosphotransferase [uncultured Amnibacterium sp.]|uniref:phosphotransferase n=1 Tax=uncultured Amnibacterium sp. TaxID=1631851 RepID=UPI0035C9FA11
MIRAIHDASEAFRPSSDVRWQTTIPSPGDDLICHNDLAPWNLILGDRWVFIDWDAAGPSTRLWDLAYAAQAFTLQDPARPAEYAAARLRAFVHGYRADSSMRDALPQVMLERADAMVHLLKSSHDNGREPWASMHRDGHGSHWAAVARYTDRHQSSWRRALSIDAPVEPTSR